MTPPSADTSETAQEREIRDVLRRVIDPEVGVNIVDLGLVYRVELRDGRMLVELTMTSPACPMAQSVLDDAQSAVEGAVPEHMPVDVFLVWTPPWQPSMMSEAARRVLGWTDA